MRIGLTLSGGGAKGVACLGVLKALEELEIPISSLSGSSSGGIMAALYSYGYSPEEILELLEDTRFYRYVRPSFSKKGLFKMLAFESRLKKYIRKDSFDALKIPLTIAATDVNTGKTCYFKEGELIKPLLASATVPVLFAPVKIQDKFYVDGGILQNMPAKALVDSCDKIIGVHCNPNDENFHEGKMSMRRMMERALLLTISSNVFVQKKYCDVYLEPKELKNYRVFDIIHFRKIFDLGYQECMRQKKALIEMAGK